MTGVLERASDGKPARRAVKCLGRIQRGSDCPGVGAQVLQAGVQDHRVAPDIETALAQLYQARPW